MKKMFMGLICSLAALVVFAGCSDSRKPRVDLTTEWHYARTTTYELPKNAEFFTLQEGVLQNLQNFVPGKKGYIWLKKTFTIPQGLKNVDLGVYLGRIAMADATYINGHYVGGEGLFPPYTFSAWNTARYYHIPENCVNYDGENEILIKIYGEGEISIVSTPFIGSAVETKAAAEKEAFWNSRLNLMFAFAMLIIALYHLILFCQRTKDYENLLFALLNLFSAVYMVVFYISDLPGINLRSLNFLWFQKVLSSSMPFVLAFFTTTFVNSFFKRRDNIFIILLRHMFLIGPVVFICLQPDYFALHAVRSYMNYVLLVPVLYIIVVIFISIFKKRKDALALLLGFSPFVITIVFDVLVHDVFRHYAVPYISGYGWQLVLVMLLFVLAARFARARKEVEELNEGLEKKVEDRTRELAGANLELELKNEAASRDMKLAVFVQQSFYQSRIPADENWDIALAFKPMSGVSGDLYDFFTEGNKLTGVGLFDVSGHGISSGLVTMLSKTVIDRRFESGKNLSLSDLMGAINDDLVLEKGDIQNYLTGVLLRIKGDRLEYVNAGHPAVLYRSSTGKVAPVEVKNAKDENAGGILGIDGLNPHFSGIGFGMKSGDAILLYTDCLTESLNNENEPYGMERAAETFARAQGTAQEKLDYVLSGLADYTGDKPANDDLTVIVLQKK